MENYLTLNGKRIDLTDEQVREIESSLTSGRIRLSEIPAGDPFKIGEHEFIVLEHRGEETAVLSKDALPEDMQFGEDNNNFADENCIVRKELMKFADKIEAIVGKGNLIEHTVDLTSDDGLDDYGSITAKVSIMTTPLSRKYVRITDKYKVDRWCWLATPHSTPTHGNASWVKCVAPSGRIYDYDYGNEGGVRPFCILKSNIFVSK